MATQMEVESNTVPSRPIPGLPRWRAGIRWLLESPTEAPEPPDSQDSGPLPGMRGWFKALTAASVLAAAGFIAKFAHEQMLGIPLSDWSVLNLGLFAGRWIMDTLNTVLSAIPEFRWYIRVLLLFLFVPIGAIVFLPARHRMMPWLRLGAMIAVCFVLLKVVVQYEIPTISLNGWAVWDPFTLMAPTPHPGRLGWREEVMKGTFLLAKLDGVDLKRNQSGYLSTVLNSGGQAGLLDRYRTAGEAQNAITHWYAGCFLACLLSCLGCWLFRTGPTLTRLDEVAESLYYFAIYVLIPVSVVLLPYMYGKLICSASYPTVNLEYIPRNGPPAQVAAEASAAKTGETTGPKSVPLSGCPLLESSDSNLRVIEAMNGVTMILLIEKDQLTQQPVIHQPVDVVTYVLEPQLKLE